MIPLRSYTDNVGPPDEGQEVSADIGHSRKVEKHRIDYVDALWSLPKFSTVPY